MRLHHTTRLSRAALSRSGRPALGRSAAFALAALLTLSASTLMAQAQPRPNPQGPGQRPQPPAGAQPQQPAPTKLPANWQPPRPTPPSMEIDKPLMTSAEAEELRKSVSRYRSALRTKSARLDDPTRSLIRDGVKYRVYSLTLKENRQSLGDIKWDISQDLNQAGTLLSKPDEIREFRRFVVSEYAKRAAELLDNQFYVRLAAVTVLAELNLTNYSDSPKLPTEAYVPAAIPLLQVVTDETQPVAVKLSAVNGLARILWSGTPGDVTSSLRLQVAQAVAAELQRGGTDPWYQKRLCDCLTATQISVNLSRQPFVVQALVTALSDNKRHWMVRSEAAKALGRVPIEPDVNLDLIAHEIIRLTKEMAQDYNAKPKQKHWIQYFQNVYLTFQPLDADEKAQKAGLLTTRSGNAKLRDAYNLVVPVFQAVIDGRPVPPDQLQQVSQWLQQNKPNEFRVAPGLEPISPQPESQTASAEAR